MRYIVKCMKERAEWVKEINEQIPELEMCWDTTHNAMDTFRKSLVMSAYDSVVHLEDDIVLCNNFKEKIEKAISEHPNNVIQFFSMRGDDLTIGSRYINGSKFMMNQCVYLPSEYSHLLLMYFDKWCLSHSKSTQPDKAGYDLMMADFLKERKENYWNHIPNLVNHREAKSLINPRRSSKRQSKTFKK